MTEVNCGVDGTTLYEGLFEGIGDADEVAALVGAVSPGLRPRPHGQVVEQVAVVVIRVRRPEAAFGVPTCRKHTELVFRQTRKFSRSAAASVESSSPGPDVGGWGGGPCPLAVKRKGFKGFTGLTGRRIQDYSSL